MKATLLTFKSFIMIVAKFSSFVAVLSIATIAVIACKKEIKLFPSTDNKKISSLRAYPGDVNSTKQERKILFVSNRDDAFGEIYSMNTDGSNLVRLTFNTIPDGRATWSSNGQHIAFASGLTNDRDIFVMNANGNGLRNITNTPGKDEQWPEWSREGNNIIFSSNRDGNHEIYLYNSDNESTTRLTNRLQDDQWPTYSPDGSKIAFQSNMGATKTDIFVMDANGSNMLQLTNNSAFDQMPTWSPDGAKIAFMSTRAGNPDIYIMNADGSGQVSLISSTVTGIDARPSWSRESDLIVFASTRDFPTAVNNNFEIYIVNGNGSSPLRLTNNLVYDDYPFIK